jgi:hypothetical protein
MAKKKKPDAGEVNTTRAAAGNSVLEWAAAAEMSRATVTKLVAAPGPERLRSVKVRGMRRILESPQEYLSRIYQLQVGSAA